MYGDTSVAAARLTEGFTELAFGGGDWVGSTRLVGVFAFFHPDGRVATIQSWKFDGGDATVRGPREEVVYPDQAAFEKFISEWGVKMSERRPFADTLEWMRSG